MTRKNPRNEIIKREYFKFLKHADRKADSTIRVSEKAIRRFEVFTKYADFKTFDQKQAIAYKSHLTELELAKSTILSHVTKLKRFLKWLSRQAGYKSRINPDDVDYLNLSEKDQRAANSCPDKDFPTLAMVRDVVARMSSQTPVDKRNRALLVTCALTGIRGGALISLRIKHFQRHRMLIVQDPREVNTKFSKLINSLILPIDNGFEQIFLDWIDYLEKTELFTPNDPMFPKTTLSSDLAEGFKVDGFSREHWQTTAPLRRIFDEAFTAAGMPSYTPHRFRDMIVKEMYDRDLSIEEFKAWSMSLGHESAMTTLTSYGKLSLHDMLRLIRRRN